ncbi:hypothetical protein MIR68_012482 [Amoeboaphelidium protococcarum]|nr:hypothetical protein MIR68_012482 [Amoeboaphelidium protococcarum]
MSKTPQDHQYQGTLPPGWTAVWDDNEGDYYFWNNETNETTWDNPSAVEKDTESSKINHHQPSQSLQDAVRILINSSLILVLHHCLRSKSIPK